MRRIKKMAAFGAALGVIGAAGTVPAHAVSGDFDTDGLAPRNCDVDVWWNTSGNPMAGATLPNPIYCIKTVTGAITISIGELPPLPDISAE